MQSGRTDERGDTRQADNYYCIDIEKTTLKKQHSNSTSSGRHEATCISHPFWYCKKDDNNSSNKSMRRNTGRGRARTTSRPPMVVLVLVSKLALCRPDLLLRLRSDVLRYG